MRGGHGEQRRHDQFPSAEHLSSPDAALRQRLLSQCLMSDRPLGQSSSGDLRAAPDLGNQRRKAVRAATGLAALSLFYVTREKALPYGR